MTENKDLNIQYIYRILQAEKKLFSKDNISYERKSLHVRTFVRIRDLVFVEWPMFKWSAAKAIILPRYTFTAPSKLRAHNFPLVISIHRE